MALHKLVVDDFYDASYSLLAIHCRLEDYRLAFHLNKILNLRLERQREDLDVEYFSASYSLYQYVDEQNYATWHLISNVCKKEEDSLQSSGSLFTSDQKILNTYHLLPELKNVDYLIKISMDDPHLEEGEVLNKIQRIPQVITAYSVDVDLLKSRDNLIF